MNYATAQRQLYAERAQQEAVDSLRNDRPSVEAANAARPFIDAQTALASIQELAPAAMKYQQNREADALYEIRTDFLREDAKLERVDPSYLSEKIKNNKIRFDRITSNYNTQLEALKAGYPEHLTRLLNEERDPLKRRLALEKYAKNVQNGLAPYLQNILSSGIPLRYKDGTVINVSDPELGAEQVADIINFATKEYFKSKGFFGDDGRGGLTDDLLRDIGFGATIEEAEHRILQNRIKASNEAAEHQTLQLAGELILNSLDADQSIPFDTILSMLQGTKKGTTGKNKDLGDAWDWLFKQVETIANAGDLRYAEKLLNQLEEHPKTGRLRILKARATLYEKAKSAVDGHNEAAEFRKSVIESDYRLGRIDDNLLEKISGNSKITDAQGNKYNPEGVIFNWRAMVAEKTSAAFGNAEDVNDDLWAAFRYDGTVPNPTEKWKYPVGSHDTIDAINKAGNTYAARKNDENKDDWLRDREQIEGAVGSVLPNWQGKIGMLGTKFQKMAEAAVKDYEHRIKQLVGEGLPITKAMDQAQKLVLDQLKAVTDAESAKKNIYYLTGNRGYDANIVGNIQTVDDFLLNNVENLDDLTELTKSEEYSDFITAFGRLDKKELQSLKYVATGKWWKQGKLPPTFELFYNNLRRTYPKADYLTNFPPNQKGFARALLTASGTKFKTDESDGRDKAVKQIQESGDPRSDPYLQCLAKVEANPSITNKLAVLEMAAKCGVNLN
tara:strand:+ start:989 stop:3172 length:2184 start_codon:yes stop_codon:yes gene_type:complete